MEYGPLSGEVAAWSGLSRKALLYEAPTAACMVGSLTGTAGRVYRSAVNVLARYHHSVVRMVMLALSVVVLLGHIALPTSGHANFAATPAGHDDGAHHGPAGAHIASCDAAMSQGVPVPVAPESDAPRVVLPCLPALRPHEAHQVLVAGPRSPLFLLHASLRI